MIEVNGKVLNEHGLSAKADARLRAGLYDARMLALLQRDITSEIEEHVFSMIQVVYDLQRSLEDAGARLEPPADLSSGEGGAGSGRLKPFMRRMKTRFIRAVNEGYVQQQEKFNTFFTKAIDLSYRQLCGAMGGIDLEEAAERRDLWASRRPEWEGGTSQAVCGLGKDRAVIVGIPGTACLEAMQEGERLLLATDTCDSAVAEAQARFLPAWFHPRPAEVLAYVKADDLGLVVIAFPECLTGGEMEDVTAWAGEHMGEGGVVLIALNRGRSEVLCGDPGFVRFWPRRFLEALMRRHGFEVEGWQTGGQAFLKGEKGV
ncbi:MAG: hypothetical protein C4536_02480 [Actinobacteria bacterium]|jgi:hypothetical protein|nr:MAG: hypothetical protein C4536_02480 [Actinomycetota bacterium]